MENHRQIKYLSYYCMMFYRLCMLSFANRRSSAQNALAY